MSQRNLPPLEVGKPYLAADFQRFEFDRLRLLSGSEATLRLHLKNGTTIDLPTTDAELRQLLVTLMEAYPPAAIEHVKRRGWLS